MLRTVARRSRFSRNAVATIWRRRASAKKSCQAISAATGPAPWPAVGSTSAHCEATGATGRWYGGARLAQPPSALAAKTRHSQNGLGRMSTFSGGQGGIRRRYDSRWLGLGSHRRGVLLAARGDALDEHEEQRHEEDGHDGGSDHAAHNRGADRVLAGGAGAGADGQRQHAEAERQ